MIIVTQMRLSTTTFRDEIPPLNERLRSSKRHRLSLIFTPNIPTAISDLYDVTAMPLEFCKAYHQRDLAVMVAYGFSKNIAESECVVNLMKMYQQLARKR